MSNYIQVSNQNIKEIIEAHPTSPIINLLKEWKSKYCKKDYHSTLDSLTFDLGLGMGMYALYKEDKVIGWMPFINYSKNNIFNKKSKQEDLLDMDSYYKNVEDCHHYLTKETIYKLMTVENLEKFYPNLNH